MEEARQVVRGLDVVGEVKTHVVGQAAGVSVGVVRHVRLIVHVVVLSRRQCRGAAGRVVEVAREAVALGELVVEHGLHLVGPVVVGGVPLAVVQRHGHPLVVLTHQRAREGVAHPPVHLPHGAFRLEFDAVGLSAGGDDVGLEVVVHQQNGRTAVVQVVVDMPVVHLGRELVGFVVGLVIDARCRLPSTLGLDVGVREFPDIGGRHDERVRHHVDVLVHGVEARLEREALVRGIAGRQAQLGGLVGLDDARHVARLRQRALRGQFAGEVEVNVARPQRVEHRIAHARGDRQAFGERALVTDVSGALQGPFGLQLVGGDTRRLAQRLIAPGLHIVVLHGEAVGERLSLRQKVPDVQPAPQLVDAEAQAGGHGGRVPVVVEVVVVVVSGRQRSRHVLAQHRAPLGREVAVAIAIAVLRAEREAVAASVAIDLEAMPVGHPPRQHTAEVIEVGTAVLVAALLGQPLQNPVAEGGAAVQQQRHAVSDDGYLEAGLAGEHAQACRAREFLHVGLLRADPQHAAYAASVLHGDA